MTSVPKLIFIARPRPNADPEAKEGEELILWAAFKDPRSKSDFPVMATSAPTQEKAREEFDIYADAFALNQGNTQKAADALLSFRLGKRL